MRQYVPPEQLWTEFQGDLNFEYDHDVYWPALIKMCEEKHAELKARWINAGKNYGESEIYLKGGDATSITGLKTEHTASVPQAKDEKSVESALETPQAKAAEESNDTQVKADTPADTPNTAVKVEDDQP